MVRKRKKVLYNLGDGVGPVMMQTTIAILKATGANIIFKEVEIGQSLIDKGLPRPFRFETLSEIRKADALLKAPTLSHHTVEDTHLEGILHTELGIYASLYPCRSYSPMIPSKHPDMNLLMICESQDELRTLLEYRQTEEVSESVSLISAKSAERVSKLAFHFAHIMHRKKITALSMSEKRLTDKLFLDEFHEVAKSFKGIKNKSESLATAAGHLAESPENYDVLLLPAEYSGIIVDIAAEVSRAHHLTAFGHIGEHGAFFESPLLAEQDEETNQVNPTSMIHAAVLMLLHLGFYEEAAKVENALLRVIEEGYHTADIYTEGTSQRKLTCQEFGRSVIDHLGLEPNWFDIAIYNQPRSTKNSQQKRHPKRSCVGVDVFVSSGSKKFTTLKTKLRKLHFKNVQLQHILGAKSPSKSNPSLVTLRFFTEGNRAFSSADLIEIIEVLGEEELDCIKTESLYDYDGIPGYSPIL